MIKLKLVENNSKEILKETLKVLRRGGMVVFPTDTVYGLLVDATDKKAVDKLIGFKNRPAGKPVSVFVSGLDMMKKLALLSKNQEKILEEILPGPYTVILKSKHLVDPAIESEKGTLGLRLPKNKNVETLIKSFAKPVTATSANLSSQAPHYSVETMLSTLSGKKQQSVDLIVDAGVLPRNKPSTVIDFTQPEVKVLRQGDVNFFNSKAYLSTSPKKTKDIAKKIFEEQSGYSDKPLVFIIEGELGVGKTVFIKGIGERLGINNIISPTFVIYYEYGNFYHFDLYQIEEKEEFKHLGIGKFLKPGNTLCFEWGEKTGDIYDLIKSKAKIIYVKMKYINEGKREIVINF
ncbi:L-threonylcarbamoyladenylate synthase [Patescibacteria group bacterium]|nr:L-threonylcarbamoyladenylate synthase [Patescibacteria group bacterium]